MIWNNWLIVIPARLSSTRLPEKPLADLCGKPLVVRVYERLKPLADKGADVVIANCAIKLAEKRALYADAFRVLRPGGQLLISDLVTLRTNPGDRLTDATCLASATQVHRLRSMLCVLGFDDVAVAIEARSMLVEFEDDFAQYVISARITATKPAVLS